MKKYFTTKRIAFLATFTALTMAVTFAVRIPMSLTNGYLNIGDTFVFLGAALYGPVFGAVSGGLGSALADLAAGYVHYAVPTLLIKGAEGALTGILFLALRKLRLNRFLNISLSMLAATIEMAGGYFITAWAMYGSFPSALTSLPWNLLQGGVSLVLCLLILRIFSTGKSIRMFLSDSMFFHGNNL